MKNTLIGFLVEANNMDTIVKRLGKELEVVDRDTGNVFVVRDHKLGDLTGKEHTFDVQIHNENNVSVHPHCETDHDRAAELERVLSEGVGAIVMEVDDKRRAAMMAQLKQNHINMMQTSSNSKKQQEARLEKEHGPEWRDVVAKRKAETEQRRIDNNKKAKMVKPAPATNANRAMADSYAGKKSGNNWTGD